MRVYGSCTLRSTLHVVKLEVTPDTVTNEFVVFEDIFLSITVIQVRS